MSDFVARVSAQLDTTKAEQQFKALTKPRTVKIKAEVDASKAKQTITGLLKSKKFTVDIKAKTNIGKQVTDQLNKASGSAAKAGANAGKAYQTALENAIKKGTYNYNTGKYKADSAVFGRSLSRYDGQLDEVLKKAREYKKTYDDTLKSLDSHFQGKTTLTDEQLSASFDRLKEKADSFKNSMREVASVLEGTQNFKTGKYSAESAMFGSSLSAFDGQMSDGLKKAREYKAEYDKILSEVGDYFDGNKSGLSDSELGRKFDELKEKATAFRNAMKEVEVETTKSISPIKALTKSNEIEAYYNKNTKAIKKYGAQLQALASDAAGAKTVGELKEIDERFQALKMTISAEGLEGKSLFDVVEGGLKHVVQFASSYGIIRQIPQMLSSMVKEVIAVDSSMVELRKVSNATDIQIEKSFDAATVSAKKYGIAISDVINSQADWARLGYGVREAQQLADATTLLQTVGDNMTQQTSSQGLISILKGYQMDVSEVESIVDKLNQVANTQPIDTEGLVEALERSVSSMAAAGNTLDETIGLITAANSVVQNPESVGTAFKTISMRIRGAKTELEEAGLDTDGMASSVSELRKELLALSGVDIQLDDSTFKSTYQIIEELSEKWDDLTDITRANITELIAGKRQGNIISALMTNFDVARDAADASLNKSVGSAQKELEHYQEGIEYSIGRFKVAFQELSADTFESSLIKSIVDGGTQAIEVIDNLVESFGHLEVVVGALAGGKAFVSLYKGFDQYKNLGAFMSAKSFDEASNIAKGIGDINRAAQALSAVPSVDAADKVDILVDAFKDLDEEGARAALGISDVAEGASNLGDSFSDIKNSIVGFIEANKVILGIGAVIAVVYALAKAYDAVHISASEALESFQSEKGKFENTQTEVEEINTQLDETRDKIEQLEAKGNLSLVEQEDLAKLREQNSELERTLQLKEAELRMNARNALNEAHKTYNEWTTADGLFRKNGAYNGYDEAEIKSRVNDMDFNRAEVARAAKGVKNKYEDDSSVSFRLKADKDNINALLADYQNYENRVKAVDEKIATYNGELSKKQEKELQNLMEYRSKMEGYQSMAYDAIANYADVMQQVYDTYTEAQRLGIDLTDQQQQELLSSRTFLDSYQDFILDSARTTETKIEEILSADNFEGLEDKLKSAAQRGDDVLKAYITETPNFKQAMDEVGVSVEDVMTYIKNLADPESYNISEIKEQLKEAFSSDDYEINVELGEKADKTFDDWIDSKSDEEIEVFYRYVNANDVDISGMSTDELDATLTIASDTTIINRDVVDIFSEAKTQSKDLLTNVNAINTAINSQKTGASLDFESYSSDELKDYQSALEYVNGTMQYNIDKVKELTEAKVNEQIATNDVARTQKQTDYIRNAKEIENLRSKLITLDKDSNEYESTLARINSLQSQNDGIITQCNALDLLNSKLRESIGAYQAWKDAQNVGDSGDMATDVISAMGNINNAFDTESDEYGRFFTPVYEAAVDFIVPDEVSSQGQDAVKSYVDNLKTYFTGDMEGAQKFVGEAIDKGLIEYTPDGNGIQIAAGKTMKDFAEAFNFTDETTQAMFGDLQTYFGQDAFSWADESIVSLNDLKVAAMEAGNSLTEKFGDGIGSLINLDVSDLPVTEQVDALNNTIQSMAQFRLTLPVDSTEYQEAGLVIQAAVAQKQQLEAPAVLSVDTSLVEGKVGEAITLLQQYQQAQNELELQSSLGVDTTQAQASVDALKSEIENFDAGVMASLSIDTTSMDTLDEQIAELSPEIMVKAGIDDTAIIGYTAEDKEAKVKYDIDTSVVDGYIPNDKSSKVIYSVDSSSVASWTPPMKYGTIQYNASIGGGHKLNGTAHLSGTANISGDWGAKKTETSLVGEVGREIVVDPRTGKWYTVGDNGAEFVKIPKDAIVFNNAQSEELLKRGFVNGRGSAMLSGTANVTGGGYNSKFMSGVKSSSSTSSATKKATSATNAYTNAVKSNTVATTSNTSATNTNTKSAKKFSELYDWVAVRLEYFGNKTKEIADKITDYISSAMKTNLLSRQLKAVQDEIEANATASRLYKEQADTVARQTGMSNSLVSKAQTGEWQFENLSESATEKVEAYLKYYDNYTKATQKVQELRNEQLKLFEDWANMPTEEAEKKVDKLSKAIDGLKGAYNIISSGGSAASAYGRIISQYAGSGVSSARSSVEGATAARNNASTALGNAKSNLKEKEETTDDISKDIKKAVSKNKKKVSSSVRKKINNAIKNGTKISLTNKQLKKLPSSLKKQISNYNKAIAEELSADKSVANAQARYNDASANLASAQSTLSTMSSASTEAQRIATKYKNDVTYNGQNAILDAQLKDQKSTVDAYNNALIQTAKNISTATVSKQAAETAMNNARSSVAKKANEILGAKKYTKYLSTAQKSALKSGGVVNTSGIKNKATLNVIKNYNKLVSDAQTKTDNASMAASNYQTAITAQESALENLANAQQEYAQMLVDNEKQKFENIQNYYNAQIDYQKALEDSYEKDRKLKEAYGQDTIKADYQRQIDSINKQSELLKAEKKALETQLSSSVSSGLILKNSEEWYELQSQIISVGDSIDECTLNVLELQDTMREEVFYRQLNKALDVAENLRSALSTVNDLITDEMMFDDEGFLSNMGITSLAVNIKEYQSYLNSLSTLLDKRNKMISLYNNGNNDTNYSQTEFESDINSITKEIQDVLRNANSARQTIASIISKTTKAELDATTKAIDARSELLKKQKEYYDYDSSLKSKTKDLQLLDAQIAALDGVEDAESRAMKARLEAQREEAKEDLDETIRDHVYQLQIEGLDDLKTELQENYDNYVKDLNGNLEVIVDAVDNATNSITGMMGTVNTTIQAILDSYGVKGLNANTVGVPTFASGTQRVGKRTYGLTNERGGEIVIGEHGVFVPMNATSGVLSSDLTKNLFGLAENYTDIMNSVKNKLTLPNIKSNEGKTISPIIQAPITITGNNIDEQGVIRAINKQLPIISKTVQEDIRKDLRKSR